MLLEVARQISEKYSNINLNENSSSERGVVPWGQTDRHDEVNIRSSQFFERR
jgi:hypothetical protein